jgi:hypothetical protein
MVLSRSSAVAMMRGVSWALAIWTATRSELKVKTMKDSIAATNICKTFCTTSTLSCHVHCHCSRSSIQPRMRINTSDTP